MSDAAGPLAPTPRTARAVIDTAIRENRLWEYLCYGLTVVFGLTGASVVVIGAVKGDGSIALSGSAAGILVWPALHYARDMRRTNLAIRLLEVSLGRAKSAREAADLIREAFRGLNPAKEK